MSKMNDGGPAFPRNHATRSYKDGDERVMISETNEPGLSLRDYFAAAAMQGLLCNARDTVGCSFPERAKMAYDIADAMLAVRGEAS